LITRGDDFPIHQTAEPVAYVGGTRNFYDRYFFNGYHRQKDIFFAAALGVYPYVNVMDAAFSFIIDGHQHNLLASKAMHMERLDTQVGPIGVDVIEPLQRLRVTVADEARGLHADLVFTGRVPVQEEPRFTRRVGTQLVMDSTRLTQNGTWSGSIRWGDHVIELEPEQWWGTRDRSWGVRGIGERDPQPNPEAGDGFQFYWLWAPINWADCATFYHLNDDEHGRPWNTHGVVVPQSEQPPSSALEHSPMPEQVTEQEGMALVSSELDFIPGTRHAREARLRFEHNSGSVSEIVMRPRFHWYMKGVGYGHDSFAHGTYHGELDSLYEHYPLAEVDDATNLHIQAICDTTMSGDLGVREGRGVLEQLIVGPHSPSGFVELMDFAK